LISRAAFKPRACSARQGDDSNQVFRGGIASAMRGSANRRMFIRRR
jgi:hypothetical protein